MRLSSKTFSKRVEYEYVQERPSNRLTFTDTNSPIYINPRIIVSRGHEYWEGIPDTVSQTRYSWGKKIFVNGDTDYLQSPIEKIAKVAW